MGETTIGEHVKEFVSCNDCGKCPLKQSIKLGDDEMQLCVYLSLFIENYENEMYKMITKHLGIKTR